MAMVSKFRLKEAQTRFELPTISACLLYSYHATEASRNVSLLR